MAKKRRKITFIRPLHEIGGRYQNEHYELVEYRGQPALREKTFRNDGCFDVRARKQWIARKLLGYVNKRSEFCFFYPCQMGRSKKYPPARKVISQREDGSIWWQAANKDGRKTRPTLVRADSIYYQFFKVALDYWGDKILLGVAK